MAFYEVNSDAYADEIIPRNDIPHYPRTMWPFVKLKQQTS